MEVNIEMYVQFREFEPKFSTDHRWVEESRRLLENTNWAICTYDNKVGIALLDLPRVPWYMEGSPILIFMTNQLLENQLPPLEEALKKTMPHGEWRLNNLGVPHSALLDPRYDWGSDREKVERFLEKVNKGEFIDPEGSPCDVCVDEQQFYGCPFCEYNPLADENDWEEEWEYWEWKA
jgi:hypothetical protein